MRKWPLEPVSTNGRGMHVLGFVPLCGLKTVPLHPSVANISAQAEQPFANASTDSREASSGDNCETCDVRGADGIEAGTATAIVVRGPARWKKGKAVYEHGNYGSYYGYRGSGSDLRLASIVKRLGADVFKGKDILDIGCNTGLVTIEAVHSYGARSAVGLDIDADLIQTAKSNRRAAQKSGDGVGTGKISFRNEDILVCPLKRPPTMVPERFDLVLCFSVTKWLQFAHGDVGIRRLFKRCFKRLHPGGILALEPQEWSSYKKKRHITAEIRQTVASIELRPEMFNDCLIDLGFELVGTIQPPSDVPKGFQRSIRLFRRPELAESAQVAAQELGKTEDVAQTTPSAGTELARGKRSLRRAIAAANGAEAETVEAVADPADSAMNGVEEAAAPREASTRKRRSDQVSKKEINTDLESKAERKRKRGHAAVGAEEEKERG
eukprot:TRINITY_DN76868_c0_g1_i1.p1 TRINITY_DN76868_c0_g1~~TRINITY_DN76868_c0_g1_i1.p1  ORF type:complete len:438 (-),score=75.25 TRINITY_DN76868_c0_g1_i1:231-1544(-)